VTEVRARGFRGEGPGLVFTGWPSHIVLIHGAGSGPRSELEIALSSWNEPILRLEFADTVYPKDRDAPTPDDIDKLVSYTRELSDRSRLLIMCPGGYGRSTAAAVIAEVVLGSEPEAALSRVLADRPRATPNRLMIAMADGALACRGRLWSALAEWAARSMGVNVDPPIRLRRSMSQSSGMAPRGRKRKR
jgi:predicted protein tyrosine phosphatase